METKHTPGPWKPERVSKMYGCYDWEIHPHVIGSKIPFTVYRQRLHEHYPIAIVQTDDPEAEANARLIAGRTFTRRRPETASRRQSRVSTSKSGFFPIRRRPSSPSA
jgi:hypothetical protein